MSDLSIDINNTRRNTPPTLAYREIERGIKNAVKKGEPVIVEIAIADKTFAYNINEPEDRARVAFWKDAAFKGSLKDVEPERYVMGQILQLALDESLPKCFSYNDPEGVPVAPQPGDPIFDAEERYREAQAKKFISDHAPQLIEAYDRTFGNNKKSINREDLEEYERRLGMIGWALQWSCMHPNELRWWLFFGERTSPFRGCNEDLRERITALLRSI